MAVSLTYYLNRWVLTGFWAGMGIGCTQQGRSSGETQDADVVQPLVITEPVRHDTDDPAIWLHPDTPEKSLILGTDKDADGALYVFDLQGKIIQDRVVRGLKRPNNVDIAYGLKLGDSAVAIAVVTEREANALRIFRLPDMKPLDHGGIPVFENEELRAPMGIGLYTRPSDNAVFAIVSRKNGPGEKYLWQYRLEDDGQSLIKATLVRKFGKYSGKKEIESVAVDNEAGYVYYSDEQTGIRKYHADPDSSDTELALIGVEGYKEDNEGISIYKTGPRTGYILVSDQSAGRFCIYRREGEPGSPHTHKLLRTVKTTARQSDGSDVTNHALGSAFPRGLFVAMSEGKTFHYYRWEDIIGEERKEPAKAGVPAP